MASERVSELADQADCSRFGNFVFCCFKSVIKINEFFFFEKRAESIQVRRNRRYWKSRYEIWRDSSCTHPVSWMTFFYSTRVLYGPLHSYLRFERPINKKSWKQASSGTYHQRLKQKDILVPLPFDYKSVLVPNKPSSSSPKSNVNEL